MYFPGTLMLSASVMDACYALFRGEATESESARALRCSLRAPSLRLRVARG